MLSVIEETRKQHTLLVVDANPAHPLFDQLSTPRSGRINLIVSSPRDDALLQAKRLADELGPRHPISAQHDPLAGRPGRGTGCGDFALQ